MNQEQIKKLNKWFDIYVSGKNYIEPVNKSVRFNGLKNLIGEELAMKYAEQALSSDQEAPFVYKLRRGLKITFYDRTS